MEKNDLINENQSQNETCSCVAEGCQHNHGDGGGIQKNSEESIDPKTQKFIFVSELDSELKSKMKVAAYSLLELKMDVDNKKQFILYKAQRIKDKTLNLAKTYRFKLDQVSQENEDKSVKQYISLLEGISKEIEQEFIHNYVLLSEGENKIEKLAVSIDYTDSFEEHVNNRIQWTKKFVKDLNKSISVSCSRYLFGLEDQERHLFILESNLKRYNPNK